MQPAIPNPMTLLIKAPNLNGVYSLSFIDVRKAASPVLGRSKFIGADCFADLLMTESLLEVLNEGIFGVSCPCLLQ